MFLRAANKPHRSIDAIAAIFLWRAQPAERMQGSKAGKLRLDRPLDPDATKRVRIPDAFLHVLVPSLGEGSTLLVTDEPILESTTGVKLAILSSSPEDTSANAKK